MKMTCPPRLPIATCRFVPELLRWTLIQCVMERGEDVCSIT